ncbi:OmpA family protein [Halorhodospira halophila]|uniref:OmpA/MotB domain protein n=1 Tax=Halorhodospira halophila (strain DSM 244 / SL1) TaxID=349124 RepID=A1WTW9_HALHL|nr:OmpA family protein [Halorhodospira halophila]ABM61131.1 OmpA/MotB domain protein [Halorhodospira halophila SL1]MBK1729675.1 flagellar motor protein MotB [Halorhodospira halophila]
MRYRSKAAARGSPAWMTTFADLMAVLVVFFVMLYTMSTIDNERYQKLAESLRQVLGPSVVQEDTPQAAPTVVDLEGPAPTPEQEVHDDLPPADPEHTDTAEILEALQEALAEELAAGDVELGEGEDGVLLRFPEQAAFALGSKEISEPFVPVLDRVAGVLADTPGLIRVSGHTDDIPIRSDRFRSNFELSTARAISVVHILKDAGITPERLIAQGHGETRPLAPNETPEQRARNRRVDVHLVDAAD